MAEITFNHERTTSDFAQPAWNLWFYARAASCTHALLLSRAQPARVGSGDETGVTTG